MPDIVSNMQTATDEEVEVWGKEFRTKLPDSKYKRLFDQFIRSKSDTRSGTPQEKLIPKRTAIQEAVKYYSIKYEIDVPNFTHNSIKVEERKDEKPIILQVVPEMDTFIKKKRTTTISSDGSKSGRKKKEVITEVKEKKRGGPKKKVEKEITTILPVLPKPSENLVVSHIEENMESLTVDNVEIIPVTIMEYDGKKYYCDEKKGKLYETSKTSKPGKYVGRWNPRTSTIETDIPDSDSED